MRNSDHRAHRNLKYTYVSKANEERTSTCSLRKLNLTTVPLSKNGGKPFLPRWGSLSWEQVEDTKPATLMSSPRKRENDITVLEQEVDQPERIITQQNQIIQSLGDQLLTSPRPVTTTKPRDVPLLELS